MGLEMEGCTAVAWAIPCRWSNASHLYVWDAESEMWRYSGAGRHDDAKDDAGGSSEGD